MERITDPIADYVEIAIGNYSQIGEVTGWDMWWTMVPAPSGAPMPLLVLLITLKNPLLGQPPLWGFQPIGWESADQASVNVTVQNIVADLRAIRADSVKISN